MLFISVFMPWLQSCTLLHSAPGVWTYCACLYVCSAVIRTQRLGPGAAVLALWPPVEEEWHSSKQEMELCRSPHVVTRALCFLPILDCVLGSILLLLVVCSTHRLWNAEFHVCIFFLQCGIFSLFYVLLYIFNNVSVCGQISVWSTDSSWQLEHRERNIW